MNDQQQSEIQQPEIQQPEIQQSGTQRPGTQQPGTQQPHYPRTPILVARILTMVLENGTALTQNRPCRHSVTALNDLRNPLLRDPFFDDAYRPEELAGRTRGEAIMFVDLVVLLARLLRVLVRKDEGMMEERIEVRNACLDQPFFDRGVPNGLRPFSADDGSEEEEEEEEEDDDEGFASD